MRKLRSLTSMFFSAVIALFLLSCTAAAAESITGQVAHVKRDVRVIGTIRLFPWRYPPRYRPKIEYLPYYVLDDTVIMLKSSEGLTPIDFNDIARGDKVYAFRYPFQESAFVRSLIVERPPTLEPPPVGTANPTAVWALEITRISLQPPRLFSLLEVGDRHEDPTNQWLIIDEETRIDGQTNAKRAMPKVGERVRVSFARLASPDDFSSNAALQRVPIIRYTGTPHYRRLYRADEVSTER